MHPLVLFLIITLNYLDCKFYVTPDIKMLKIRQDFKRYEVTTELNVKTAVFQDV
jgi:hypothetical protein